MARNSLEPHSHETPALSPVRHGRSIDPVSGLPLIDVAALLGAEREAVLLHNGECYRLRVTANNRLILTK